MYVGILNNVLNTTYTHEGTTVPFPPSSEENGALSWGWKNAYDSPIDINKELSLDSYIGAVTLDVSEKSITKAEILVDGKVSGKSLAKTGDYTGGKLTIPVGVKGKTVTARLHTTLKDVAISGIEILGAYDDEKPLVWPTPKNIEYLGGFVKIKDVISCNNQHFVIKIKLFNRKLNIFNSPQTIIVSCRSIVYNHYILLFGFCPINKNIVKFVIRNNNVLVNHFA